MQKETADIILGIPGHADRFKIKWCGFTFRLKIKPLTARQIIRVSRELCQIRNYDNGSEMFPALLEGSEDLKHICRAIAIATGTKIPGIITQSILKLNLSDILTLFKIIHKQCDAERFFFIIALTKGVNKLKTKAQ